MTNSGAAKYGVVNGHVNGNGPIVQSQRMEVDRPMAGDYDAAMLMAIRLVKTEIESARPDAPVVPDVRRSRRIRHTTGIRSALARALDRAARAVEPPAYRTLH